MARRCGGVAVATVASQLSLSQPVKTTRGTSRSRNVVLEFKDYATALACYDSPEYRAARALRQGNSTANLIIIEGYDGDQP